MQFGLPPRNSAYSPSYSRGSRASAYQRRRLRNLALLVCGVLVGFYILFKLLGGGRSTDGAVTSAPLGVAEVVVVTVFNKKMDPGYMKKIKENREYYAKKQGYDTFFAYAEDYNLGGAPVSWGQVPAMRHALTVHSSSTYFYYLSPHSVIMNPAVSIQNDLMAPKNLESILLKDKPVVPPESVIHTFSHLKGQNIDLVLTQDDEGLCPESIILRRGEWAHFFLDTWFDPLYRSYNFQKAETHALEHIVQWHPTILTKLALIPQRFINSYGVDIPSRGTKARYEKNDFVVRAPGCEKSTTRKCDEELERFFDSWKASI